MVFLPPTRLPTNSHKCNIRKKRPKLIKCEGAAARGFALRAAGHPPPSFVTLHLLPNKKEMRFKDIGRRGSLRLLK